MVFNLRVLCVAVFLSSQFNQHFIVSLDAGLGYDAVIHPQLEPIEPRIISRRANLPTSPTNKLEICGTPQSELL